MEFIRSGRVDSTVRTQKRREPLLSLREPAPIKIRMRARLPNRRILVALRRSRERAALKFTSPRKDIQDVPKRVKASEIDPESGPGFVPTTLFLGRELVISISRSPNRLFGSLTRVANASKPLP